jgi:ribose 5-phosphate isomerase B
MSNAIPIGSDHAGFRMKSFLISYLKEAGHEVEDVGCFSEERADYPDFGHEVASRISSGKAMTGILLCGSGNGIAMSANKHKGVRAAICWNEDITSLARRHNDANILVLPARYINEQQARSFADIFLKETFEGGRHEERVRKIEC